MLLPCLNTILACRKGAAYGLAGVVKGLQIRALNEYSILATLKSSLTDKVRASKGTGPNSNISSDLHTSLWYQWLPRSIYAASRPPPIPASAIRCTPCRRQEEVCCLRYWLQSFSGLHRQVHRAACAADTKHAGLPSHACVRHVEASRT